VLLGTQHHPRACWPGLGLTFLGRLHGEQGQPFPQTCPTLLLRAVRFSSLPLRHQDFFHVSAAPTRAECILPVNLPYKSVYLGLLTTGSPLPPLTPIYPITCCLPCRHLPTETHCLLRGLCCWSNTATLDRLPSPAHRPPQSLQLDLPASDSARSGPCNYYLPPSSPFTTTLRGSWKVRLERVYPFVATA